MKFKNLTRPAMEIIELYDIGIGWVICSQMLLYSQIHTRLFMYRLKTNPRDVNWQHMSPVCGQNIYTAGEHFQNIFNWWK